MIAIDSPSFLGSLLPVFKAHHMMCRLRNVIAESCIACSLNAECRFGAHDQGTSETCPLILSVILVLLLLLSLLLPLSPLILFLLSPSFLLPLPLLLESVRLETTHALVSFLRLVVNQVEGIFL